MQYTTRTINGSTLGYMDYPGEKGPIIAVHGLTGNYMQLHHTIEMLKGEYRIIAVDVKGRGQSVPLDTHTGIDDHVADLVALLQQLHIEQPILLGFSMGGFIVAKLAQQLNCQAVLILDGAASAGDHQEALITPSLSRINKSYDSLTHYIETLQTIYASMHIPWSAYLAQVAAYELIEQGGVWRTNLVEEVIRADFYSLSSFDAKAIFSAIHCPILLVHANGQIGDKQALFLAEHYAETLVYAEDIWKVTVDTDHYSLVFEEHPIVKAAISHFLSNLPSA